MFGTMGISELIIILVIVLIIFGAGKLPQIGEGVGKALKGFKKEVHDIPTPEAPQPEASSPPPAPVQQASAAPAAAPSTAPPAAPTPTSPYTPGPEMTPGTTAASLYNMGPQVPQPPRPRASAPAASAAGQAPPTMEERAAAPTPMMRGQYPPLPPGAQSKPQAKRPSAIVNKDAVARVQAQQAELKSKSAQSGGGVSPADMQHLGEGLGDALRTFKQAVADVRNSVDPEMRTIQAEMDAAQKEIQQSIEAAREMPAVQEDPPKPA
ncbi:MAG TPA: twin-arginine translocase TatA/TatE family subunit [Nitrospira sp.]|nr:twin-arginine translocase TatA/TatE family subunit [Nitrospira sp.]